MFIGTAFAASAGESMHTSQLSLTGDTEGCKASGVFAGYGENGEDQRSEDWKIVVASSHTRLRQ
jgi:hypothetical protein